MEPEAIVVGVNAEESPWVSLTTTSMQGDTGWNGFGGEYGYADGGLTPGEAFGGLAYCGVSINDDSLTQPELAI